MDDINSSSRLVTQKKITKIELSINDVSFLVEYVPEIPKEIKEHFVKSYGRLLDLILVPVRPYDLEVMKIMIQFWHPQLKPAFALAIYGMVLFPFANDMVDHAVIDVFSKFTRFRVNLVAAILAETFLLFQKYQESL
ncbi:hypothetical protein Lal_00042156 [Lupinus albus]|nr:hypothetical protein Lal_00042156 [Lupinus albus]